MSLRDRILDLLPWSIAALFLAGAVHIVSILLMPYLAPKDAYHRLLDAAKAQQASSSGIVMLDATTPGDQLLPSEDPALAEGACVYDLSGGLLRLTATVDGENFLGISFHSAVGPVFHALTDRGAEKNKIEIVLGTSAADRRPGRGRSRRWAATVRNPRDSSGAKGICAYPGPCEAGLGCRTRTRRRKRGEMRIIRRCGLREGEEERRQKGQGPCCYSDDGRAAQKRQYRDRLSASPRSHT